MKDIDNRISVFLIDESVSCRDLFHEALSDVPDIRYLGAAPNAKTGLERFRQNNPDVMIVCADSEEYPVSDTVREAIGYNRNVGILITTEDVSRSADEVVMALEAGAFDYVLKPSRQCGESLSEVMARRLLPKIRSFSTALYSRRAKKLSVKKNSRVSIHPPNPEVLARVEKHATGKKTGKSRYKVEVVLVGISTGGPEALLRLLSGIPPSFRIPIIIVIHMPRQFISSMSGSLRKRTMLQVCEARDGEFVRPGDIYLSPGDVHLKLGRDSTRRLIVRTNDGSPENGCKPSADVLFRSAAQSCPSGVLAVIMTGMGEDGTRGLADLKKAGAYVLAQDEQSSIVWGMPGSAVRADLVDEIVNLDDLPGRILTIAGE